MNGKRTRRSFFGSAGAALAAPLAATVAFGGERGGKTFVVGRRELLEDMNAIRTLQLKFARLAGAGKDKALVALFADAGCVSVDSHVRCVVVDGDDSIQVLSDGTATARVPCIVTTATPIEPCGTLVEMARLQGDGFITRSERRVLESSYVKRDGVWKIERVTYASA
jgi:hypothetical protein